MLYTEQLVQSGLTSDQAIIYETLIKQGQMPASKITLKTGIKRGMVYKTLDLLAQMKLIEKIENKDKVTTFRPNHPSALSELIESNLQKINQTKSAIESVLGNMSSDFNLLSGKPNVRFFEGMKGIESLYEDINREKKDIKLIRSPFDNDREGFDDLIGEQIKKQIKYGINTKAITPLMHDSVETTTKFDKERLTERRFVSKEDLMIPAQIIIYGEKVAITSFKEHLMTTIIQNSDVKETFEKIFEFMWKNSKEITQL